MLTIYDSFAVPDVPNVKIYRDDTVPHRFYMVSERATIARDDEGKPLFTFILYARDVEHLDPDDLEVERGYLALTTQAAVTKEAEERIRAYLRQKLIDENSRGYSFLFHRVVQTEPELGYPPLWLDGTVEFRALTDDMVPYSVGSNKPSLIDTNVASFSASLNQEGAELFRQAVTKGVIPAGIWYNLSFAARIPAIQIRIHGDRGEFYDEVKNYIRHRWTMVREKSFLGITYSSDSWIYEWDELSSISRFHDSFHNLRVEIDDSSLPDSDRAAMQDQLETMALEILQSNILPTFFQQAIQDIATKEEDPQAMIPEHKHLTGRIDVSLSRTEIIKKEVNPNAQLAQVLTPEEVEAQTLYVDLGQPYFQELDVSVHANVNFETDPVFALIVNLEYDQLDELRNERVRAAKSFDFRNSSTIHRFRQIMAKDGEGAPKKSYRYSSELTYRDTGETIRVPRTGSLESNQDELVISYRRLGFVKVNLVLGTMPESVRAVEVKMRYPGYSGPSAEQTFELTLDKPTATFFTYTGSTNEPQPYRYQLSYVLTDGQRMEMPEQSGQSELLTVRDPFENTVTARFVAQADFSVVEKIIIDGRYEDVANDFYSDHHAELVANGESSEWTIGLRDPDKKSFHYLVTILYKNGSRTDQPGKDAEFGTTVIVGAGAVDALEISVFPSLIDWTRYRLVVLSLEYKDPENQIHETKDIAFQPDSHDNFVWRVLLRDKDRKNYRYRIQYFGQNGADSHEIPWTDTTDTALVVENG